MRIRQILIILVDNAIKFTPADGTVNIQARIFEEDSSLLVVEVSDSGRGISPDMTERVFDRLFQASGPALAGRKGLGLGLYICKDLVTRQGGQIWVQSTPGRGAVFSVTLPIFSLPKLIAPAWTREKRTETPLTLVVAEIGSQTGCLSEEARAEQFPLVRELLQRCLHSDQDVLLPRMGSAVNLFFIVAITDAIGGDAISKRIRGQFDGSEHLKQAGLTLSASYRSLGAIRRNATEPMEDFLEEVGAKLQKLMDEEESSRMVKNG